MSKSIAEKLRVQQFCQLFKTINQAWSGTADQVVVKSVNPVIHYRVEIAPPIAILDGFGCDPIRSIT
jgi:hypothetical protein